ncbi:MAG: hypothetical protein JWQ73_12 [Variovorax sp.]|jgi:hypothetical protein|nr:hypothetical protein [Variovorax sp.]
MINAHQNLAASVHLDSTALLAKCTELPGLAANDGDARAAGARALFERLWAANGAPDLELQRTARGFIEQWRQETRGLASDLPPESHLLQHWLDSNVDSAGSRYKTYLAGRKEGAPRRYFTCRSHALFFLRAVAPTKLVDGAWLYGLLSDSANPQLADLLFTYIEELGDGEADKNHVLLYRRLLDAQGITDWAEQPDERYVQGALQLALGACSNDFLPEIIGFNLGYEQLPLHLLITAYELDELGIDPTYFALHVTVDNGAGGHAQRALRSVAAACPALADHSEFWARLEDGYRLSSAGFSTLNAIESFDAHAELVRVLDSRAREGRVAHSDYCRIEGKTVNQWLSSPEGTAGFVAALQRRGWLDTEADPATSRFWQLLQGEPARMFGVFGDYELQVIYDWIRGRAAKDGARFARMGRQAAAPRPFRHSQHASLVQPALGLADLAAAESLVDADVQALRHTLATEDSAARRGEVLRRLLGPAFHWRPVGLEATRYVSAMLRAAP